MLTCKEEAEGGWADETPKQFIGGRGEDISQYRTEMDQKKRDCASTLVYTSGRRTTLMIQQRPSLWLAEECGVNCWGTDR